MYSYFSKQGHLITENQDTIIVDRNLWLVCDGHGKNGKSASDFVSRVLHESLSFLFSQENNVNVELHDI
jgi:serine/threonine protein phosphatase PrpC